MPTLLQREHPVYVSTLDWWDQGKDMLIFFTEVYLQVQAMLSPGQQIGVYSMSHGIVIVTNILDCIKLCLLKIAKRSI